MRRGCCNGVLRGEGNGASARTNRNRCWLRQVGSHKAAYSRNFGHHLFQTLLAEVALLQAIAPLPDASRPCRWPMPRCIGAMRLDHSRDCVRRDSPLDLGQKPLAPRHPLLRGRLSFGKTDQPHSSPTRELCYTHIRRARLNQRFHR